MESNTTIEKSIEINASPSKVWEILTSPELIKIWLSDTGIEFISGFKVGRPVIFSGKWHGVMREDHGLILECEPEKIFKYSFWTKISRLPDIPENHTVIEFRLIARDGYTILNLTHSNLIADKAYEHSNYYWGITLSIIKKMAGGN